MVPRPPTPVKRAQMANTKAQSISPVLRALRIPEHVVQEAFTADSPRRAKFAQTANTKVPMGLPGRRVLPIQRRATLERLKGPVPRPQIPVKHAPKGNIKVPTVTLGRLAVLIN